ncbi:MAG: helix-turn-helix domain-containing protein [Anaerolineales bacterium]|nr:helix-turn-helix domain-containing protein [Anaerolineales bacterium]
MMSSFVLFNDLLRLTFSEPITWLSGVPEVRCTVNWVTTLLNDAQAGDLLVLVGEQVDPQILMQAKKRAVAAVLLLGEVTSDIGDLPSDFPILSVAGDHDLQATQRLLLTVLVNQRAALVERGVRIHTQLSQLAAEGGGLAGILHALADISGRGVLLQDKRGRILAEHPSSTLMAIWGDVLEQLGAFESLPESLRDRKRAGVLAEVITQDIPGNLPRLVSPVIVGEVARGYLSLVSIVGDIDTLDRVVIEQGALACALEMSRDKAVRETEKRLKGDLLTALLQEDLSPRDAELWTQGMGFDLNQPHVALRFAWDAPSSPSRRRLETIVNGEVSRMSLKTMTNPIGVEVVSFCELPSATSRPELALEFGQAALDQAFQEYPEVPIRCGIGNPARELSAWRDSFRQAGQALEMARRFEESKALYFPDLSVYRLLFQFEHNPELIAFQEEILGPLLAYEGGRELLLTLESYFEHNGNMTQTAEALFIHRNTLIYRLERIAKIADLDLDKPETRLAVQLALHISRMRSGIRGKPAAVERKLGKSG